MTGKAKNPNWGGPRPNSGPKPMNSTISALQLREMLQTAKRFAEEHGKTVDDIILEFAYDAKLPVRDRLAALKIWKDKTMIPVSEGSDTDKQGPTLYLPELKAVA